MCQEWCLMVWLRRSNIPALLRHVQSKRRARLRWLRYPRLALGTGERGPWECCWVVGAMLRALPKQLFAALLASAARLSGKVGSVLHTSSFATWMCIGGPASLYINISDILESQLKCRISRRLYVSLLIFLVKMYYTWCWLGKKAVFKNLFGNSFKISERLQN